VSSCRREAERKCGTERREYAGTGWTTEEVEEEEKAEEEEGEEEEEEEEDDDDEEEEEEEEGGGGGEKREDRENTRGSVKRKVMGEWCFVIIFRSLSLSN